MMPDLSRNTQAILLLTAPLIVGRSVASTELLTPGEYKRLALHLRDLERQPADLLSPTAAELLETCQPIIAADRLKRLLERGLLLSQAIEHWQTRAIWILSRADADYPARLKLRLKEDAPAVLYGCGERGLLESGGLAVVGSRHVDDRLIDETLDVGKLAARAGKTLISGGAKGIDQAAMRGALDAGGRSVGIVADSLAKTTLNREHRQLIMNEQLVLVSPYDPSAGFNVGHAMQRNKLIYALADVALVMSSDLDKGGTWAGAKEQLDKLRLVPVYVRSTGTFSDGLAALRDKGARLWPNPEDVDAFVKLFDVTPADPLADEPEKPLPEPQVPVALTMDHQSAQSESTPAEALFESVRQLTQQLLQIRSPLKDAEIATALAVSPAQAKLWLERLVTEGMIEKPKKPAGYILKQSQLF